MRICHVSPHLPPDQAANAILPAELGKWAAAAGDAVAFLTYEPAQGRPAPDELPGPVTRLATRRSTSAILRASKIDSWRRARAVFAALDEIAASADLLHLHSNGLIIEAAASWARRRRKPFVLTLYGTEIWHYRRRWPIDPFARAYMRAKTVVFYSQRLCDRARELGLDRADMAVIYPAVRDVFTAPSDSERDAWRRDLGIAEPRVILNVKRLHELAGQEYLLDAFADIAGARPDVRLVICGAGALRPTLEAQTARLGIAGRVTFTGLVSNDLVARYAAVADVFALPSLLEALPTVAVESLAAGTPVVSADHPGGEELHEIFGDDVRITPKRDVPALAAALRAAIEAPRRTKPQTRATIERRFSAHAVEGAYAQIYRGVRGRA